MQTDKQKRQAEHVNRWRAKNPERAREVARRTYEKNKEKIRERQKLYREANPRRIRSSHLKTVHGITLETYEMMLAAQGGVCAICLGPPDGRWGSYHVDHDHRTGVVRGLLCNSCNLGLGKFKDSITRLSSAQRYLVRTGGGSDGT
jgi:hypothetical protein